MVHCNMKEIPLTGLLGIVLHRSMNTAKELYREFDLNRSTASILFMLHKGKSMSQKELAGQLNITAPSITSSIQKMERAGYITRRPDTEDQRIMRLNLTEKGESCICAIKNVADRMDELMLEGMSKEEKMLLRKLLLQVNENLENRGRKEKA